MFPVSECDDLAAVAAPFESFQKLCQSFPKAIRYIRKRAEACEARLHGQINQALTLEKQADNLYYKATELTESQILDADLQRQWDTVIG